MDSIVLPRTPTILWAMYQHMKSRHNMIHPVLETIMTFYKAYASRNELIMLRPDVVNVIESMLDSMRQWINIKTLIDKWVSEKCEKCKVLLKPFMVNYANVVPTKYELQRAIMYLKQTTVDVPYDTICDIKKYFICKNLDEKKVPIADRLYMQLLQKIYIDTSNFNCTNTLCESPPTIPLSRSFNTREVTHLVMRSGIFKVEGLLQEKYKGQMHLGWVNRVPLYFHFSKSDRVLFCEKLNDGTNLYISASVNHDKITEIHFHLHTAEVIIGYDPNVFSPE